MMGAIYTGLSGMTAYSRGLDIISNNVANLNTPGFKLTKAQFSDIERQADDGGLPANELHGAGVSVDASQLSLKAGELRSTGNSLDAAIDGNGFFVLDRDGEQLYTRAGQFEFNEDGDLVEKNSGAKVMVRTDSGAMESFNIDNYRSYAPKATSTVTLTGNLARTGDTSGTYSLASISTVDTSGGNQVLSAKFVRDTSNPLQWSVELFDASNTSLGTGTVLFGADGTPATDQAALTFTVKPANLPEYAITLNIGSSGSFSGLTSTAASTTSSAQVLRQDGIKVGSLTDTSFDETGRLKLTYSNGESKYPATLLLASFEAPNTLKQLSGGLFAANHGQAYTLDIGLQGGRGSVVGGQLELSNVDLTEQFTELIVVQRGYQASSQAMSVANEMLQQLLSMQSGR